MDISSSFEILSILLQETNKIKNDYYEIAETIIRNIKLSLNDSYEIYNKLEHLECVKIYCRNGVYEDKGFSKKSDKNIRELQNEVDELVHLFENDKDNIEILKKLESCEEELREMYRNLLAFLFEMVCEDNPFEDHSELRDMVNKKVFNHINDVFQMNLTL